MTFVSPDLRASLLGRLAAMETALASAQVIGDPEPPPPALPPAHLQPYDPGHAIYRPIPAGCPLHPSSATIVAQINPSGTPMPFDTGKDSPPVYVSGDADPTWTGVIAGREFTFRAPTGIAVGTGSDYPMVVLDRGTEYRFWQAVINRTTRRITCSNGGVGLYGQVPGATGRATIHGSHTGSGNSYLVGMVRPHEIAAGRIPHALRVACNWLGSAFVPPADRSDSSGSTPPDAPMGCRVFIDPAYDLAPALAAIDGRLSNALARSAAKTVLRAIQEYGVCPLDSSGAVMNVYFEGDQTANWETLMGPRNSLGTWNDISRAVSGVLPFGALRVAAPGVFA